MLTAFPTSFRSALAVLRKVAASASTSVALLTAVTIFSLLLTIVVVVLVALLAGFHVLFVRSTLVRHWASPWLNFRKT
jgi:hypothetical protein